MSLTCFNNASEGGKPEQPWEVKSSNTTMGGYPSNRDVIPASSLLWIEADGVVSPGKPETKAVNIICINTNIATFEISLWVEML